MRLLLFLMLMTFGVEVPHPRKVVSVVQESFFPESQIPDGSHMALVCFTLSLPEHQGVTADEISCIGPLTGCLCLQ